MTTTMTKTEQFEQQDAAMERTLASHAENLKQWIEAGCCVRCRKQHRIELNERNITFRCCDKDCGWFAIYPIRTLGNSERAMRDESLDLVAIAECEVLEAAKAWAESANALQMGPMLRGRSADLFAAVKLLESREQVRTQIETEKNERLLALMP